MYVCEYCGAAFREPDCVEDNSQEYGDCPIYFCPECGEEIVLEEADGCPECHGWKRVRDAMCPKCQMATVSNFKLANRGFSRIQLDYISDLSDGEYLSDFMWGDAT